MPTLASIINRFADTDILYFAPNEGGDSFGKPNHVRPIALKVRWEEKQQEILLPDGRKVLTMGYVLLSTKLVASAIIWKGTMAQWTQSYAPERPTKAQGGMEIVYVRDTPGIRQLPGNVYEVYF